jgi:Uma2 family endonuclease
MTMNILTGQPLDKAAFIAGSAETEARCELVAGYVVEVPRVTRGHALVVGNVLFYLHKLLDRRRWATLKNFGLDAGSDTVRYPDVVVDRAGGNGTDYTATAPALLIEVLSPETAATDLGDKVAEYLRLPTLLAYIVLSEDEPKAWARMRASVADKFPPPPRIFAGRDAIIHVAPLQLDLPLAEMYADIEISGS